MATNKRISALDNLGATPAVGDILPITDVDDFAGSPQGTTKGVTFSDLTNHLATTVSLGNHASLTSAVHGISAFGATLVDDANATIARTTLGLGTAATTASTDYATSAQGALADSATQPGDLGTAASKNVGTSNGNLVELDATGLPEVDGSQLTNLPSPDVNGPLTTALRGTDNPHLGAFPNQSFKVVDNPFKSVMIVADEVGNLKLLNSLGINNIAVGFSVVEDGTEPDIEVVSGSETYSVISGDSDTKGANGLPTRQGFNYPDIGANPAPILISGGTIA